MDKSIVSEISRLRGLPVSELRVEWERLYGEPSRSRNRVYLWRRLAYRIQELAYGGLSDAAKARLSELAPKSLVYVRGELPKGFNPPTTEPAAPRRDPRLPSPGSTLVRKYRGDDVRVLVLDDGFEWNGRRFDTLSELAFAVTGSRWNGWLFFGLTKRKR